VRHRVVLETTSTTTEAYVEDCGEGAFQPAPSGGCSDPIARGAQYVDRDLPVDRGVVLV